MADRRKMGNLDEIEGVDELSQESRDARIPSMFISSPPIRDSLQTLTSDKQDEVLADCLPYLKSGSKRPDHLGLGNSPKLNRHQHIAWLKADLEARKHVGYDSARPWFFYWDLSSLGILGENVLSYHDRQVG